MIPTRHARGPSLAALTAGLVLAGLGGASFGDDGPGDAGNGSFTVAQPAAGSTGPAGVVGSPTDTRRESPSSSSRTPARLELPGLGVAAPVIPVGVDPEGVLDVPPDPDVLGWWRGGARPGQSRGSILIAGHVDTVTGGFGVFARLAHLEPGAPVLIETAGGGQLRYRITDSRQFPKAELPAHLGSVRDGPERLLLITCGGQFDRDAGGYSDNVVAFAVPDR